MLVWALPIGLALAGCDRQAPCPPCECNCEGGTQAGDDTGVQGGGGLAGLGGSGDLGELVASANRKLAHGDGPGCLADLDRVKLIDPRLDKQLVVVRAQCQMATGECQTGKQAITDYYVREQALTPERAAIMAESIASMRCAGGDATERDQLLVAYYDLSDGAYINKRDVEYCTARVATIAELAPKVAPRDVEDTQISGNRQALFYTGAMCFARAGDCDQAYQHFRRFFPSDSLDALDPSLREATIRETFDSTLELCKPAP